MYARPGLGPWSDRPARPWVDAGGVVAEYRRAVSGWRLLSWSRPEPLRALMPVFAFTVAVVAVAMDPSSGSEVMLAGLGVVAFAAWAFLPGVPLPALCLAVLVPAVLAQRSGQLEPMLFQASLIGFVVGLWASSPATAITLGALAICAPVTASALQDPSELSVGIWMMGIAFPWALGRALAHQRRLTLELDVSRRELARQALLDERRRIARDVHDFVGHGLAAMMLQVTSARHVLRRDPADAETALRAAEDVGRRSMQELRRTVALLRSDDDGAPAPLMPSAADVPALIERARAGGLNVDLRRQADLSALGELAGVALYRIVQETLANASRHAPRADTEVAIYVDAGVVHLRAETTGPVNGSDQDAGRPRYGLIGMRERATALGGDLEAGPTTSGWRVSCQLPLAVEPAAKRTR